jgi:hypothetical protein
MGIEMADDNPKKPVRLEWKYSKARDVLELWDEASEKPRRIRVPGTALRALTSGVAVEDLPHDKRAYILNEFYVRPRAYGAAVIEGG